MDDVSGSRVELPAWKDKYGRMALQGRAQQLGPLNTKVDPTILDAGNGGLGDAAQSRQLCLAQTLQLADDTYRLARGDVDALFCGNEFAHISVSDSHVE